MAEVLSVRPAQITLKDVEKRATVADQDRSTSVLSFKCKTNVYNLCPNLTQLFTDLHLWMVAGAALVAIVAAVLWTTT